MRIVAVGMLVGWTLLGCSGGPAREGPRVAEAAPEDIACSRDSECVLVEDCCGCALGGTKTAVRADRVEAVAERDADTCEERTCGSAPSEHRSCEATAARCAGGRCIPAL